MKRKQKTPRRIRPTETSEYVDDELSNFGNDNNNNDVNSKTKEPETVGTEKVDPGGVDPSNEDPGKKEVGNIVFQNVGSGDCPKMISNYTSLEASDTRHKRSRLEAETQTDTSGTVKLCEEPDITNAAKPPLESAFFRNEPESVGMPLILDVFSLSQGPGPTTAKQIAALPKQDSFPVTPPCSPPLAPLGVYKAPPNFGQNYLLYKGNPNLGRFPRESVGAQAPQVISQGRLVMNSEPQIQHFYNPMEQTVHNPHGIANGVLPLNLPANQAEPTSYGQHAYVQPNNTRMEYYYNNQQNRFRKNGRNPISQLTDMFSNSERYLVSKESFVTQGKNLYTRFKLQQEATRENRPPNQYAFAAEGQFQQPVQRNQGIESGDVSSIKVSNVRSNAPHVNNHGNHVNTGVNALHSTDNGLSGKNDISDPGCAIILNGYGRNMILRDQTHNSSGISANSQHQSTQPEGPSNGLTTTQFVYSEGSSDDGFLSLSDTEQHFLTPRDVKVQKLKKLLEQQEELLKKLRTTH